MAVAGHAHERGAYLSEQKFRDRKQTTVSIYLIRPFQRRWCSERGSNTVCPDPRTRHFDNLELLKRGTVVRGTAIIHLVLPLPPWKLIHVLDLVRAVKRCRP